MHLDRAQERIDGYLEVPIVRCKTGKGLTPDLAPGEAGVMAYEGFGCEWHALPEPGFGFMLLAGVIALSLKGRRPAGSMEQYHRGITERAAPWGRA